MDEVELRAVERIASALESIAETYAKHLVLEYPPKKTPTDATVTHPQTDDEALRESQGASDETDEEWIGRREHKVARRESRAAAKRRTAPPRGGPEATT